MVTALVDRVRPVIALLVRNLTSRLFLALAAIAVALVVLHAYIARQPWDIPGTPSQFFRLDTDRGLSEWFEYAVLAAAVWAAFRLFRQSRETAYALIAAVLAYFLLDNSLELHEVAGALIAPASTARGEEAVSLAIGLGFLGWWLLAWRRAAPPLRVRLEAFAAVIAMLGFFGVAVDAFHSTLGFHHPLDGPVALLEDGGEMMVLTFLGALIMGWRAVDPAAAE